MIRVSVPMSATRIPSHPVNRRAEHMQMCLRMGMLALGWLTLAGSSSAAEPAKEVEKKNPIKPSTARTLRLPEKPYHYANLDLPAHFRTPGARRFDNTPRDNPVTDTGATLGRVLFYDTRLSANNTAACASCHEQKRAFAIPERFAKGFEGKFTDRNA